MYTRVRATIINVCLYGCLGLFFGTLFQPSLSILVFVVCTLLFLLFTLWFVHHFLRHIVTAVSISFLLCFFYAGVRADNQTPERVFERGELVRDIDIRIDKTFLTVSVADTHTYARLSVFGIFECPIGSDIVASTPVKLKHPKPFTNSDGRIFHYDSYLRARNISLVGFIGHIDTIKCEKNKTRSIFSGIFAMKHKFLERIQLSMHEPYASLGAGLTLGEKGSMEKSLQDAFMNTSLTHILVLSGYNIMIIVVALTALFGFAHLYMRVFIISLFIVLFIVVTGAEAPTIRAGVMGIISLIALLAHRKKDIGVVLAVVAFGMGLYNPALLTYDPGFHLSFIATLGLVLFATYLKHISVKQVLGIRTIIATSLVAQISVLPYVIYMSGIVSVVGVLANIIVLPIIPFLMFLIFLTGLFGILIPPVGLFFGYIASIVSDFVITCVLFLSDLPFATFSIPPVSAYIVGALYIGGLIALCTKIYCTSSSDTFSFTPSNQQNQEI